MGLDDKKYMCAITPGLNYAMFGEILAIRTQRRYMLYGLLRDP